MQVAELRQRLNEKANEIAASGDELEVATVMGYVRAALIALVQQPDDADLDLRNITVNTKTAALILGVHPEHLRFMARQGKVPADKENGEYRILLSDLVNLMDTGRMMNSTMWTQAVMRDIQDLEKRMSLVLWERSRAEGTE